VLKFGFTHFLAEFCRKLFNRPMKPEKQNKTDALEKEMERMIRKLDREKEALSKILKDSGQVKTKTTK